LQEAPVSTFFAAFFFVRSLAAEGLHNTNTVSIAMDITCLIVSSPSPKISTLLFEHTLDFF